MKPWHRQKGETQVAYQAFRAYLDLGEGRTVVDAYAKIHPEKAAEKVGEKERASRHWRDWVKKWRWYERIDAYNKHVVDRSMQKEIEQRTEDRRLRRGASRALMGTALRGLRLLDEKMQDGDPPPLRECTVAVGTAAEQLRQDWDEAPVQRIDLDVAQVTVEQRRELAQRVVSNPEARRLIEKAHDVLMLETEDE